MSTYTVPVKVSKKNTKQSKSTTVIPSHYEITFVQENVQAKMKIRKMATELAEHINIIEESRRLIGQGKSMTWEKFVKNETRRK